MFVPCSMTRACIAGVTPFRSGDARHHVVGIKDLSKTRKRTSLFVSALIVGGLVVSVIGEPNRADAVPADEAGPVDLAGTGETLVLVVGEVLGTSEEAEVAIRDRLTLGEFDGFHAVPASDFRLEGAYVRSAPGLQPFSCEEMEAPADRTACAAVISSHPTSSSSSLRWLRWRERTPAGVPPLSSRSSFRAAST